MTPKVRAALPCDTEGVLRCLAEFHEEHQLVEEDGGTGECFDAEEYARWLPCGSDAASTEQAFTFVADGAGEIRGVLLLCADSTLHELPAVGPHWDIAELYVAPAARGEGVGGQLLEHAVRWCARDARFALLEASSASANVRASRFYVAHGFGVAAREVRFRDRVVRPHGPHTVHLRELAAPAEQAETAKVEGGALFKQEKHAEALGKYKEALALCGANPPGEASGQQADTTGLRVKLHTNIALCQQKLENWACAESAASAALELAPDTAKALFHRGRARAHLGKLDRAEADLTRAAKLNPQDKRIRRELAELAGARGGRLCGGVPGRSCEKRVSGNWGQSGAAQSHS